jgi:hypothetical protein
MPVKQVKSRDRAGRFKPGFSGNPKGKPNGVRDCSIRLREAFIGAFDTLGGVKGLVEWAKKSNANRGYFYRMLAKLLTPLKEGESDDRMASYIETMRAVYAKAEKHAKK